MRNSHWKVWKMAFHEKIIKLPLKYRLQGKKQFCVPYLKFYSFMNYAPRILFTVENKRIPGPLLMTALKIKF